MKKVLVTGAGGFIGRWIALSMVARGNEVHALTTSARQSEEDGIIWHQCDLMNSEQTNACLASIKPDVLIHNAWFTGHGLYWTSDLNYAWVSASLSLLEAFNKAGGQRVVMVGSCAEYDWDYGFCSETVTPLHPVSPYGVCKVGLYRMAQSYSETHELSFAWARVFFPFGAHEPAARLLPSVARALLAGEPAKCTKGTQLRDFMPVSDCGDAIAALAVSSVAGAVNIGSGEPTTVRALVEQLADRLEARHLLEIGAIPMRNNEPPLLLADIRRLHDEVGWRPQLSMAQGLELTLEWWRKQA